MPTTEQKELVVHVIAKPAAGPYKNGSGFVVAPGRILTVAHVLDEVDRKTIEIRLCGLEPGNWISAELKWNGRDHGSTDLAVLSFDMDRLSPESQRICQERSHHLVNPARWSNEVR
jgi:S1-C subfamily serine protease